jgi:hypothetical protein
MRRPSGSSILKVSSQQDVIDLALDELEHSLFWEGFEEEARAYLAAYPQERNKRDQYAGTSADRMKGRR